MDDSVEPTPFTRHFASALMVIQVHVKPPFCMIYSLTSFMILLLLDDYTRTTNANMHWIIPSFVWIVHKKGKIYCGRMLCNLLPLMMSF